MRSWFECVSEEEKQQHSTSKHIISYNNSTYILLVYGSGMLRIQTHQQQRKRSYTKMRRYIPIELFSFFDANKVKTEK